MMLIINLKGNKVVQKKFHDMPSDCRIPYKKFDSQITGNFTDDSVNLDTVWKRKTDACNFK